MEVSDLLPPPGGGWQKGIDFFDENRLNTPFSPQATVAQLVEQLIRNQ